MAEYRQLKVAFWYNSFVLSLSSEERAFFSFMITNPATTRSGIYELSFQMIQTLHGHNDEIILDLINKFVAWKKIAYDPATHEFMILSWMKHNRPNNSKVFARVGKEVRTTKSKILKALWSKTNPLDAEKIGQPFVLETSSHQESNGMDKVLQPLSNGIDTVSQPILNGIHTNTIPIGDGIDTNKNLENVEKKEFQKDINSSVPGYSSVDLQKEVGCSLPGLKAEEPEHKDQSIQETEIWDPSLKENQPGEEIIPLLADLNLNEANSQSQTGNQEPKKSSKHEPEPKQTRKTPHLDSADPPPDEPPTDEKPPSPEELIIQYFNQQMCTGYRLGSGKTRELIHRKLQEGFSIADFRTVIDKKIHDWQEPKYRSNLVPHVLFGDKFEAYLQQTPQVNGTYRGFGSRIPVSTFHNQTQEIVEVF
jgi:uncharacterized phage protein (TIGR02220 family)